MAGTKLEGTFIPHAGGARVITGEARNTKCRANGSRFFTSGALAPQLGDGLMLAYTANWVGGRLLLMWCCGPESLSPTLLMEDASVSEHHKTGAKYCTRIPGRQSLESCRLSRTTFVVCS